MIAPVRDVLVQADLFDLPFRPGAFATVACHGLVHLFAEKGIGTQALLLFSPGGRTCPEPGQGP